MGPVELEWNQSSYMTSFGTNPIELDWSSNRAKYTFIKYSNGSIRARLETNRTILFIFFLGSYSMRKTKM
ncbi:hypothetical protein TorRG33x02_346390 [Trema orientale]|uniref:Uncharacterized protein n=1 Tax=Trema orientale TaxID=63057 RepID=A0A2P5AMW8_TREOI|nr:hypothetical protein TorRG33x02_346390 [Trema orientale]